MIGTSAYRLGVDLLRRGEFDYLGLFGTTDRTWIEHPQVNVVGEHGRSMQIELRDDVPVRTGMRVFMRVFARSAPATLSVSLRSQGCSEVRFALQRRKDGIGFEDALADGPVEEIGAVTLADQETRESFELQLPRTATRGIRLFIDASNCGESPAELTLDSLSLVEWRTPWLAGDEENPQPGPDAGDARAGTKSGAPIASGYEPAKTCYWSAPGAVANLESSKTA